LGSTRWLVVLLFVTAPALGEEMDARSLIQAAMDHWRGQTSYAEMTMTIHRPSWERSMSMRSWTQGDKISLVRITAPKKDVGNATLMKDDQMWTFTPRVNRVLKIPSSMMSQGWMGSDFSNKDVSKSTDILYEYEHSLLETREEDGHTVYVIEAIPHEEAAVVWGKEILHIRDDYVLLEEQFWDQDDVLVKSMRTLEVAEMSGRSVATKMRMSKAEEEDEWTQLDMATIEFNLPMREGLFTLSNLRNPRE
jgi:outer membrane lipoprotein-sorting protein